MSSPLVEIGPDKSSSYNDNYAAYVYQRLQFQVFICISHALFSILVLSTYSRGIISANTKRIPCLVIMQLCRDRMQGIHLYTTGAGKVECC